MKRNRFSLAAVAMATLIMGPSCWWNCFVRGTKIVTPKGLRRIEELVVGDDVYSLDVDTRKSVVRRISQTLRAHATELLHIAAAELVIAGVTAEHPFYDAERQEWTNAGALTKGTRVLAWFGSADVREIEITDVHRLPNTERVEIFNLTVDGPEHNYFAEGFLVHNKDPPMPDPKDNDNDGYYGNYAPDPNDYDCNDNDPNISPGAAEICSDGIDNDCDERIDANDEECPCTLPFGVFAMNTIFFGETNRDGTLDIENGWKQFGENLDDFVGESPGICAPIAGGALQPDGMGGIDNSFGKNIVPMIREYFPSQPDIVTASAQAMINTGAFSLLLKLDPVPNELCGRVMTRLYGGIGMASPPAFDGTDVWPIDPASLTDLTDPLSATNTNDGGETNWDGGFRSNLRADYEIRIDIDGATLVLPIHFGDFKMSLAKDGSAATEGQLWGTIETEKLVQAVARLASKVDPTLCDPNSSSYEALATRIRQASDVQREGNAHSPWANCSAVSIGIGFTMTHAQLGEVASPLPPPMDVCMP